MELTMLLLSLIVAASIVKLMFVVKGYLKFASSFTDLPGPFLTGRSYPVVGHAMMFQGGPVEMYKSLVNLVRKDIQASGHEVGRVWMSAVPVVLVVGPNAAETLLHSSNHIKKSFFYNFLHPWLGTGLLTADGEKWKLRRKLLTPTFHFSILNDFLEVMDEQTNTFISELDKLADSGKKVNIFNPVTLCALDIICETAMGKSIQAQQNKDSDYVKALYRSSEIITHRQASPWLWWNFGFNHTSHGKDFNQQLEILHKFTKSIIRERIDEFKGGVQSGPEQTKKKRLAFLDLLLTVSDDGKVLSLEDIREEVDTFMFEGHDTTAAAMGWALHLIGAHPKIQRKIQEEVDAVLGNDSDRKITIEDVRKLEYLEMVIKESLRLFPSVPMYARTTSVDCVLDGHAIPAGTDCVVVTQTINTNRNFWSNPQVFDPERFTSDNSVGRHPYSYLPFSAGPRNCIGQRFALMEEKVMLARLFQKFSLQSCDRTEDLKMMGDLVLRPEGGIYVKISKRQV